MSYLSQPTSFTDYGVIKIGNYIEVEDGVISLLQDVSPTSDVEFNSIHSNNIYAYDNLVITSVTPTAGYGIEITELVSTGLSASFTVSNTGVTKVTAGPGISVSTSTGDIVISATGADLIAVTGTTTNYTATYNDEYIGVSSSSAVTITLPLGIDGRIYTIKDEFGQGSGKITIQPNSLELIDGKNSYIIGVPYQSVSIVFRAGQWRII